MDVIASGIEACPWGLKGYGFEPYAAESPGNTVLALARSAGLHELADEWLSVPTDKGANAGLKVASLVAVPGFSTGTEAS